jgi:hypothetical protein
MNGEVINSMISFTEDGGVDNIYPHHATRLLRGIEIDIGIYDLIKFLWDHGLDTMRSCENINGYVYISFRKVCDAAKAGLMTATVFALRIVTNDEDGGYAATALLIPDGHVQYPMLEDRSGELCQYAQRLLSPVIKNLKRTNLIKRMYSDPDKGIRDIATAMVCAILRLDGITIYVNNSSSGQVTTELEGDISQPRSKADLLKMEDLARQARMDGR